MCIQYKKYFSILKRGEVKNNQQGSQMVAKFS